MLSSGRLPGVRSRVSLTLRKLGLVSNWETNVDPADRMKGVERLIRALSFPAMAGTRASTVAGPADKISWRSFNCRLFCLELFFPFPSSHFITINLSQAWVKAQTNCTLPTPSGHPQMPTAPASEQMPALERSAAVHTQASSACPSTFAPRVSNPLRIPSAHLRAQYSMSK